jgi:hypothetical protein
LLFTLVDAYLASEITFYHPQVAKFTLYDLMISSALQVIERFAAQTHVFKGTNSEERLPLALNLHQTEQTKFTDAAQLFRSLQVVYTTF